MKLDRTWQYGDYVVDVPMLKPWYDTAEMPILFCPTATELACTNDGGDHELLYASADSSRMGVIEDVGTVGLEYVGRLLRMGATLC